MDVTKLPFAVVEFNHDKTLYVSVCPVHWLKFNNNHDIFCWWPKNKTIERKAIEKCFIPQSDWLEIKVNKVLGKYSTYKEALHNEKRFASSADSESRADLAEENKSKRRTKRPQKFRDELESPIPSLDEESTSENQLEITSNSSSDIGNRLNDTGADRNNVYVTEENVIIDEITPEANASPDYLQDIMLKIENYFIEIHECLKQIGERVGEIEQKLYVVRNADQQKQDLLPDLPLKEIIEITDLEMKIKNNEECQKQLYNVVRYVGGPSEKMCIYRCLEKVFSNYLGQFCSWTGKKGNFQLKTLEIMKIIKSGVRASFPSLSDDSFERCAMQWFQHAKTRYVRGHT